MNGYILSKSLKVFFIVLISFATGAFAKAAGSWTLESVVDEVLAKQVEAKKIESEYQARLAENERKNSLSDPKLGLMREESMTGTMNSLTFSQEIMFPAKYFILGEQEFEIEKVERARLVQRKYQLKKKGVEAFVQYYSLHNIFQLLKAQKETLREVTRIAESRRATGASMQSDEMRAHLEQTKIENEVLLAEQELIEKKNMLAALLGLEESTEELIPKGYQLKPFKIDPKAFETGVPEDFPDMVIAEQELKAKGREKAMARLSYAPDFMIAGKKSMETPGNYSIEVSMSLPLWFWGRQMSEVSQANAMYGAAEKERVLVARDVKASFNTLKAKLFSLEKLLLIYETSLMPQALAALNSSRGAYGVGRVQFSELLETERTLYDVKINYYKTVAQYYGVVSSLETLLGRDLVPIAKGVGL